MINSSLVPPIKPDMWVRTQAFLPHLLPKGLSSGKDVQVVRAEHDVCVVRDRAGQEWLVESVLLDPGQYFWIDGHWQPDSERKAG